MTTQLKIEFLKNHHKYSNENLTGFRYNLSRELISCKSDFSNLSSFFPGVVAILDLEAFTPESLEVRRGDRKSRDISEFSTIIIERNNVKCTKYVLNEWSSSLQFNAFYRTTVSQMTCPVFCNDPRMEYDLANNDLKNSKWENEKTHFVYTSETEENDCVFGLICCQKLLSKRSKDYLSHKSDEDCLQMYNELSFSDLTDGEISSFEIIDF